MAKTETAVLNAFAAARQIALETVTAEARRVLPDGWVINLAVGWGMVVVDDKHETIMSDSTDPPARLPRGVRDLLKATASLMDLFGPENDRITNQGLSYPPPRKI